MPPNLNFVNIPDLNRVLRSEVFVCEDRQLRAIHLIHGFKPLSKNFQDVGHEIKAGDSQLARIDVIALSFIAREDIVRVDLPSHRATPEAAISREETASFYLSLEVEIDQFKLVEQREEQEEPMICWPSLGLRRQA